MNQERLEHYKEQIKKIGRVDSDKKFLNYESWLNLINLERSKKLPGSKNVYEFKLLVEAFSKEEAIKTLSKFFMHDSDGLISVPVISEIFYPIQDTDEEELEQRNSIKEEI